MKVFDDKGTYLSAFYGYRIVYCPKCAKPTDLSELRISCLDCGYNKTFESYTDLYRANNQFKNFLVIPCCGQTLWAINIEHLNFLEGYIESSLRERTPNINRSLVSRLPQWIKSSKNRTELLKGISRLRLKLVEHNYRFKNS